MESWIRMFEEVCSYFIVNGTLPQEGFIADWCEQMKKEKDKLSTSQIISLDTIPIWDWGYYIDVDTEWINKPEYEELDASSAGADMSVDAGAPANIINQMIETEMLAHSFDKVVIFIDKILDFIKENPLIYFHEKNWQEYYIKILTEFRYTGIIPQGKTKMGYWCLRQRYRFSDQQLKFEYKEYLDVLPGWKWGESSEASWYDYYALLQIYVKINIVPPLRYGVIILDHIDIGKWCVDHKMNKKNISLFKQKMLEEIPHWSW